MAPAFSLCIPNGYYLNLSLHFISFALLLAPMGIGFYLGNLEVYLNSYWYAIKNPTRFYSHWILSLSMVSWSVTVIIAGKLKGRLDHGTIILIGILVFDASMFGSYFSVQHSQTAFIAIYGIANGVSLGFIQTEIFARISTLVTMRLGIVFALFNNYFVLGAACFHWIITWHINSKNVDTVELVFGHFRVFAEKSVIEHVPSVFLLLGIVTSISHWSGLIISAMLQEKEKEWKGQDSTPDTRPTEIDTLTQSARYNATKPISPLQPTGYVDLAELEENQSAASNNPVPLSAEKKRSQIHSNFQGSGSFSQTMSPPKMLQGSNSLYSYQQNPLSAGSGDLNQIQMLKTVTFYAVWLALFATESSFVVLLNFYKSFGLLWVNDDYFLTCLGMVFLSIVFVVTIVSAAWVDRYGTKRTQVFLNSLMSLGFLFYYFTPQVTRWLFAVWTSSMMAFHSALYLTFPNMTLKLFGEAHFASNYGIVVTSKVVVNILAPPVIQILLERFSWVTIFIATGSVNLISLLAVVVGLPNQY